MSRGAGEHFNLTTALVNVIVAALAADSATAVEGEEQYQPFCILSDSFSASEK